MAEKEKQYTNLLSDYNSLLNKNNCCTKENAELTLQIKNLNVTITELKEYNKKLSTENFHKFESLNSLQKEIQTKNRNIKQLEENLSNALKRADEVEEKNKELEQSVTVNKIFLENQIMTLKKQIEQLTKSNENFIITNTDLQKKLKDFQTLTNMAKANTDHLEKKDFSILETMALRAQNAELEYENIKQRNIELVNEIQKLQRKMTPLESLALLYMKKENYINSNVNNLLTREEMREIECLKGNANGLFDLCVVLKNDNFNLQQQIQDITVECNKRLRNINK